MVNLEQKQTFLVEMISFGIPETEIKIIILPTYLRKLQTLSALENVILINQNGQKMTLFHQKRVIFWPFSFIRITFSSADSL